MRRRLLGAGAMALVAAVLWLTAGVAQAVPLKSGTPASAPSEPSGTPTAGPMWRVSASYPARGRQLDAVNCPSTNHCLAVGSVPGHGGVIVGTEDGGRQWNALPVPGNVSSVDSITCVSDSVCAATATASGVPLVMTTTHGGATWTLHRVPPRVGSLTAIACLSKTDCVAGGHSGTSIMNSYGVIIGSGGASGPWRFVLAQRNGLYAITGISCPSSSACQAVGYGDIGVNVIVGTVDGAQSWANEESGDYGTQSVACSSLRSCVAVGGGLEELVQTTTNEGKTWVPRATPAPAASLSKVACASLTATCEAGGETDQGAGVIISTANAGETWASEPIPSGLGLITGLSCPSALRCYATAHRASGGSVILAYS